MEHWLLNYIIQQGKFYIFIKKQFEFQRIDFYDFLPKLKNNLKIEEKILKPFRKNTEKLTIIENMLENM